MATVSQVYSPLDAAPSPRTGFAPLDVLDGGAGDPHLPVLLFDPDAEEEAQFVGRAVQYGSGNLTVRVRYSMASATTGDVVWGAQIRALTPGDAQDAVTDTFAAANTVTDTVPGTVGHMAEAVITLSSLDGLAAGDYFTLRLYRDADAAGDTATGDAELAEVTVEYSDT